MNGSTLLHLVGTAIRVKFLLQREKYRVVYRVYKYIVLDEQVTDNKGDEDLGSASAE